METFTNRQETRIPAKEGGLELGIEKIREDINSITTMVDQIEKLQKVPHGYTTIGNEVDNRHLPALDQFIEYRGSYDTLQEKSEEALLNAYRAILEQLSLLRNMTGINTMEEAMKFNKDTGRQDEK